MEFALFIASSTTTYFVENCQVFFCRWRGRGGGHWDILFVRQIVRLQVLLVACVGFTLATAVNYYLSI